MSAMLLAQARRGVDWSDKTLRKANHFDDISEIMGRMALDSSSDSKATGESHAKGLASRDMGTKLLSYQLEACNKKVAELEKKLQEAQKTIREKDVLLKMLECENKHLSGLVDDNVKGQISMYESAPPKRILRRYRGTRTRKDCKASSGLNRYGNVAPIVIRMPNNARLGWAVTKAGVIMHRILVEFSANLGQLEGRKMMLKWSVLRRFSAFEKLHSDIRTLGFLRLPTLPGKSWFGINSQTRQKDLHAYMNKLILIPGILGTSPMKKFLNLTDEMASLVPGGSSNIGLKKRSRER